MSYDGHPYSDPVRVRATAFNGTQSTFGPLGYAAAEGLVLQLANDRDFREVRIEAVEGVPSAKGGLGVKGEQHEADMRRIARLEVEKALTDAAGQIRARARGLTG